MPIVTRGVLKFRVCRIIAVVRARPCVVVSPCNFGIDKMLGILDCDNKKTEQFCDKAKPFTLEFSHPLKVFLFVSVQGKYLTLSVSSHNIS